MTKTLKTFLIILGVIAIGGLVTLAFQSSELTKKALKIKGPEVSESLSEEEITNKEVEKDEFKGWKTYRNERYNYEIKYPENYRVAGLIMQEKLKSAISLKESEIEKFGIDEAGKGESPSLEDWVVITDMSAIEEQNYLKGDYEGVSGGYGPITAPANFPTGTILVSLDSSLYRVDEIEENTKKSGGVWDMGGWKLFDFQIMETKSGVKVRKWKITGRGGLVNASIALPEKILSPYPAYDGSSKHIENMKYFDQIRFWTPSWNYDEELFDEIISTFRFLD